MNNDVCGTWIIGRAERAHLVVLSARFFSCILVHYDVYKCTLQRECTKSALVHSGTVQARGSTLRVHLSRQLEMSRKSSAARRESSVGESRASWRPVGISSLAGESGVHSRRQSPRSAAMATKSTKTITFSRVNSLDELQELHRGQQTYSIRLKPSSCSGTMTVLAVP